MSQLTLAAVVVAVLVVADAVGHGAAELIGVVGVVPVVAVAVAAVVGVAVPEAAVVGVAVPEAAVVGEAVPVAAAVLEAAAVGDAAPPDPWWPWPDALAGTTYSGRRGAVSIRRVGNVVRAGVVDDGDDGAHRDNQCHRNGGGGGEAR